MKKAIIISLVVIFVITAAVGSYILFTSATNKDGNPLSASNLVSTSKFTYTPIDACNVLTDQIVSQTLTGTSQKISTPSQTVNTTDIAITTCNYLTLPSKTDTATSPKISGANLLIRVAKTAAGAESNKVQFTTEQSGVQQVKGIGDSAYYNPSFRQLNVLKGGNWYIITTYKDNITNGSLAGNKALAQKLTFK